MPLPPPYNRKTWDFKMAKVEGIHRAIFHWALAFQNKYINKKTKKLTETVLNIFNNFIPDRISKLDYEKPVWMNNKIILSKTC